MSNNRITKFRIPALHEFDFQIKYTETNREKHTYESSLHTHNKFELYINVSGDVSFLVENNLYELSRGDVIIARPGEYHHCVYQSDASHKLFWILFDCNSNSTLLDFLQEDFHQNYVSPKNELREELLALCDTLHKASMTAEDSIYAFFRIFAILKKSIREAPTQQSPIPQELQKILDYINQHIHESITIAEIAKEFYISQGTLERRFKESLQVTPLEYIKKKKLVAAAQMLQKGESVSAAGASVGYNDTSYFIELFKRYYGTTPHQYKKSNNNKSKSVVQ